MGYIYILTSPSGKSYIGQTIRPIQKRLEEHETGKSSGCVAIYTAIQKHGWDNFEKDWYYCPNEDLNKHEELMVEVLGTLSPDGYNLMEGGGSGGKRSDETKQKMSEVKKGDKCYMFGIPKSEEHKQNIGDGNRGKTVSYETKQKISKTLIGRTLPEEQKQKMRKSRFGYPKERKPKSEEHRQQISGANNHKSKTVYQYDLNGNFIRSFGSAEEAARELEITHGASIRNCANDKIKTKNAHGYKWSYTYLTT